MIRLREILQGILQERRMTAAAHQANSVGLEKKPGFGNWGPVGRNLVTRRTIKGHLKSVTPHRIGKKALKPIKPSVRPPVKTPTVKFPLFRNRYE